MVNELAIQLARESILRILDKRPAVSLGELVEQHPLLGRQIIYKAGQELEKEDRITIYEVSEPLGAVYVHFGIRR